MVLICYLIPKWKDNSYSPPLLLDNDKSYVVADKIK